MMHIVPGSPSRLRMLAAIYQQPGIHVTELMRKARVSPNAAVTYANELVAAGAVREVRIGRRKTHLRQLFPNLSAETGRALYALVELDRLETFKKKYPDVWIVLRQVAELVGEGFALVYGSYARLAAQPDSDLDLLVVGTLSDQNRQRLREAVATAPVEVSMKVETLVKFRRHKNTPLHQNIIREHVIVGRVNQFLRQLA